MEISTKFNFLGGNWMGILDVLLNGNSVVVDKVAQIFIDSTITDDASESNSLSIFRKYFVSLLMKNFLS